MTENTERRYLKKGSINTAVSIVFVILYLVYNLFLDTFVEKLLNPYLPSGWMVVVFEVILFISCFCITYQGIKAFSKPKFSNTQLVINNQKIEKFYKQSELLLTWQDNFEILHITDYKNLAIHKQTRQVITDGDTVFLILEKYSPTTNKQYNPLSSVRLQISTADWHIDDVEDLEQFFESIGHTVKQITAEEGNQYFPTVDTVDLGNKSGFCAIASIFWMVIGIAIINYDDYKTLDFGLWKYVGVVTFLAIAYICFKWINEKKTWGFQLVVSLLFSFTFTLMLGSALLVSTQKFGTTEMASFKYSHYDGMKGVVWKQVEKPDIAINCGDKTKHDKGNTTKTTRKATLLYTIGMVRVQRDELCLK